MKRRATTLLGLKTACLVEAATLAGLVCIAVPLKHLAGYSLAVSILGPVHGMAFLTFLWIVIHAASSGSLHRKEIWRLLINSVIPFGGFFSAVQLSRRESGQ